ncbi:MAG: hypothetical protein R3F21_02420 [Myxococcota bacterium]
MERRSTARTGFSPRLEYLAWNAAAGAAIAVMLLVLLASLEWLDARAKPPMPPMPRPALLESAGARVLPAVAGAPPVAGEACAPVSGGSG